MAVSHRLDTAGLHALLYGPAGPVAREVLRRGKRVEAQAKRLCPVDTGRLRSSITTLPLMTGYGPTAHIGSNVKYAILVHEGTGVFGPLHHRIYPVRAKFLRFKPKGAKTYVFRRSVAGMKPRRFLKDALPAAKG